MSKPVKADGGIYLDTLEENKVLRALGREDGARRWRGWFANSQRWCKRQLRRMTRRAAKTIDEAGV